MLIARVPENHRKAVLRQYMRHAVQNLTGAQTRQEAYGYFSRVYQENDLGGLLDGNVGWYLRPMGLLEKYAPALMQDANALAVDLGTGMGHACGWLYGHGWQGRTVGLDFVGSLAERHRTLFPRHAFVQADLSSNAPLPAGDPAQLFTAVNAITYVAQPEKLLRAMHERTAPGGYALIIEPHPSNYWRPATQTYIRAPHIVQGLFEKTGWTLVAQARTAIYALGRTPVLPLAQAYLYRR